MICLHVLLFFFLLLKLDIGYTFQQPQKRPLQTEVTCNQQSSVILSRYPRCTPRMNDSSLSSSATAVRIKRSASQKGSPEILFLQNNVTVSMIKSLLDKAEPNALCREMFSCDANKDSIYPVCYCDNQCRVFKDCCHDFRSQAPSIDKDDLLVYYLPFIKCISRRGGNTGGYLMVSKCPVFTEASLVRLCEEPNLADAKTVIPVVDLNGTSFLNRYCAICHNVTVINEWDVSISNFNNRHISNLKEHLFCHHITRQCEIFPIPPQSIRFKTRTCFDASINTTTIRKQIEERYANSTDMLVLYQSLYSICENYQLITQHDPWTFYKNPVCAVLFGDKNGKPSCYTFNASVIRWHETSPISVLFNFANARDTNRLSAKCQTTERYMPFLGKCVRLECSQWHFAADHTCMDVMLDVKMAIEGTISACYTVKDIATLPYLPDIVLSVNKMQKTHNVSGYISFRPGEIDTYMCNEQSVLCFTLEGKIRKAVLSAKTMNFDFSNEEIVFHGDNDTIVNTIIHVNDEYVVKNCTFVKRDIDSKFSAQEGKCYQHTQTQMDKDCHDDKDIAHEHLINITHSQQANYNMCYTVWTTELFSTFHVMLSTCSNRSKGILPCKHLKQIQSMGSITRKYIYICSQKLSNSITRRQSYTHGEYNVGAETIVTYIGLLLSIIAIAVALFLNRLDPEKDKLPRKLLQRLLISKLVSDITFVAGIGANDNRTVCFIVGICLHYLWLSNQLWINICLVHMYFAFVITSASPRILPHRVRFLLRRYTVVGLTLPLVFVIPFVVVDLLDYQQVGYYGSTVCFLNLKEALIFGYIIPVVILYIIGIYCFIFILAYISSNTFSLRPWRESFIRYFPVVVKLSALLGVGCGIGIVASLSQNHIIWIIFDVSNGFQGLFLAVAFGFKPKTTKKRTKQSIGNRTKISRVKISTICN